MMNNLPEQSPMPNDTDSRVVKGLKEKIVACGGKAYMPVIKGDPICFYLSADLWGFKTSKLPNYVLTWGIFDAIVKKAISLGGKMYRGDVAAQSGKKIGSPELENSVEELIAIENGKKACDSVTRTSTYYTGILAWAEIVTLHRSEGEGSYIRVNQEYMNLE